MLKSRKYLAAWLLTLLFSALLVGSYLSGSEFSNAMVMIWGAYFAANVGSKFAGEINGHD